MKMVFDSDEVCAIVREHVIRNCGVPEEAVTGVGWRTEKAAKPGERDVLHMTVGVKTTKGSPYREKGK